MTQPPTHSPPDAAIRPGGSGMPKQAKVTVSAVPEPALLLPEYPLAGVKAPAFFEWGVF
jgi:hypothetical protein